MAFYGNTSIVKTVDYFMLALSENPSTTLLVA